MIGRLNIEPLKNRRRKLRHDQTDAEKILWKEIRNNKLGVRFVRQFSVDNYVIDFYCPKLKLGIEIEGEIHQKPENIIYDNFREKYLEAFGVRIIKFKNDEICKETKKVVDKIKTVTMQPHP